MELPFFCSYRSMVWGRARVSCSLSCRRFAFLPRGLSRKLGRAFWWFSLIGSRRNHACADKFAIVQSPSASPPRPSLTPQPSSGPPSLPSRDMVVPIMPPACAANHQIIQVAPTHADSSARRAVRIPTARFDRQWQVHRPCDWQRLQLVFTSCSPCRKIRFMSSSSSIGMEGMRRAWP